MHKPIVIQLLLGKEIGRFRIEADEGELNSAFDRERDPTRSDHRKLEQVFGLTVLVIRCVVANHEGHSVCGRNTEESLTELQNHVCLGERQRDR